MAFLEIHSNVIAHAPSRYNTEVLIRHGGLIVFVSHERHINGSLRLVPVARNGKVFVTSNQVMVAFASYVLYSSILSQIHNISSTVSCC